MAYLRHPTTGTVHRARECGTLTRCGRETAYLAGGYESREHCVREALAAGKARYCGACFPLSAGSREVSTKFANECLATVAKINKDLEARRSSS